MKNKRVVAVSACLLGFNCRYDGKNNKNESVLQLTEGCTVVPLCPEIEGGLPCPRTPAEIVSGRVVTKDGVDVTGPFKEGAEKCFHRVLESKPDFVVLSSLSPSCGVNQIYDGSFSGLRIKGSGVFASLLKEAGITVIDSFSIRHSLEGDLPRIMELYKEARVFMAEHGNPNQWGPTNWPPESHIREDIRREKSYVSLYRGEIVGTFYFDFGTDIEPTYRKIEGGEWKGPSSYGVVHRIATDSGFRSVGRFCLEWAYSRCESLRIDTHPDNSIMQKLLERCGFVRRGIIHVEEDAYPRFAYELF